MAELPAVLKVVAPSLQEQALWKLWTCWEEATARAETLLPAALRPCSPAPGRAEDWNSAQAQHSSSLPQLQAGSEPDGERAPAEAR